MAAALAGLAALSLSLSLVWPKGNRALYTMLALVSFPIGFVLSYVIMAALFYLVITPVGLGLRLLGRDPLGRHGLSDADTYWVAPPPARGEESYFRRF